ncbi:PREDICTED: uncharacterized protein LOC104779331 [Camelina sativa]|uniref:Uncharacterized protein LOC104779331 n=1 Tax=Camelina sativa TaxID=90675 RepID=A0ABM0YJK4_CAMSA|nr:PREDICTED: uncharacterized protein LOC104779331 [Camelina sativa]
MEELKQFHHAVYEAVMNKNPKNCSRAFFKCTSLCEDVSNNFSESYNNTINQAREMPLVAMLETIRRQCLIRNDMRRKKAAKHKGKYSLKVAKTIKEEQRHLKYCEVIPCGNEHYEVAEHVHHGFRVDMNAKTCACRRWSMIGIPCRHVLRVIGLKKNQKPKDFVTCDWLLTSRWVAQYNEQLMGVNGMYFWEKSGEQELQPPPREKTKGRTKKQKRIKGKNESPKKKRKQGKEVEEEAPPKKVKITREGITLHCSQCSKPGHNTSCQNPGVQGKQAQPRKRRGEGGPSQPSQASQASQISLGD